jgi:methyl-accepting chemotaxis protein
MGEIKSGAEIQSAGTANIAKVMESISVDSLVAASSAAEVEQVSLNSFQAAEKGQATVKETLTLLVQVEHFAGKLKDISIDLNTRSEQIRKILDLLTYISRQTKVLALNANIEAAKAGEAGRGFSVVAVQIRKLADNSQQSVDNIAEQVTVVRSTISETVKLVGGFYELVEQGGNKIMEAESTLVDIQKSAKENLTLVNRMSALVQRQSGQTKGAAQMVQMIAEISEKFAMSSESVLQAPEDQAKAMQEVLDVAQDICLAVSELNKMIEECKLD